MKIIAIIPARGGSKRIERKNVRPFAGLPVIAYSIQAALASGCFDEVMVSTDDEEIAEVAKSYGAKVPFMRSAATANDFATTADVIREVLDAYRQQGRDFDALCCIYATAPFVTPARLKTGFRMLRDGKASSAFTCVEYSYPIQRSLVIEPSGRIVMKHPEYASARSQDLEKSYHDAGQFYFTTVKSFEQNGSLWGNDTLPIILPETEVQDLDTPTDWKLAEIKYSLLVFPKWLSLGGYDFVSYTELDATESERIRQGRNSDDVRRWMVHRDEISRDAHSRFVEGLKTRYDKQYYAVYRDGKLLGSVTLDRLGPDTLERGIWLFTDVRGKGHASRMLEALYRYLASERGVHNIETKVREDNLASLELERHLGAHRVSREDGLVNFRLQF